MNYTPPTVNYSAAHNGTYTTLTGVQFVNITRGRQRFQDPFAPTTCTIELIPANSYALPLAIGQYIDVRDNNASNSPCYFEGQITDVIRNYEIPYDNATGAAPADRITIIAAGAVGKIGSATVNNVTIFSGSTVDYPAEIIPAVCGVSSQWETSTVEVSATSVSGPGLSILNQYLQTGQMLIDDWDTQRLSTLLSCYIWNNKGDSTSGFAYSDTGATRFKALEYESSAQSTFNYVEVNADGLATQITKAATGPYNTLTYDTYNKTTADALDLSGYLYNLLSGQLAPVPFTLTTDTTVAATCMNVAVLTQSPTYKPALGQIATVTFRGTTVSGQIQGINISFSLDRATVQLYLSPTLGVPFTLNSATNGILGTNRLGYS
jgi:hypothetical protein